MHSASVPARPTATRCKNFLLGGRQHRFNYDDSLDVFGVHGIGGTVGTLLAGIFAASAVGGSVGLIEGRPRQLLIQLYGVAAALVWSAGVTLLLHKLVSVFVSPRVSRNRSRKASGISQYGEALQKFPIQSPHSCRPAEQDYVETLSCRPFGQSCL
jgi:ammonia channel protein AmtB